MLVSLLAWQTHSVQAQGMRKTMLEQLAALRGYIITAEKGYQVAEEGLHLVGNIKSGEFNLHRLFFQSLKTVDQAMLQNPALAESYRLRAAIDHAFSQAVPGYVTSGRLLPDEMRYIQGLQQCIAEQGRHDQRALQALTQDEGLSMMDGERIRRIDEIRADLQTRYGQIKNFLTGIAWLIAQRQKEQAYTAILKKWYGIQ